MKKIIILLLFLLHLNINGQVNDSLFKAERTVKVSDFNYREDQFYLGITHSIAVASIEEFKQNGISTGVQLGFLRDFPLNENRTIAIAPGFGFSMTNMRNNLLTLNPSDVDYELNSNYDKNSLTYYMVEIPIEFRWRNSNRYSHKFWRVYTGFKYSYLLSSSSKYSGYHGDLTFKNDVNLNNHQLGAYVVAGYNTWNFQIYYGFNSLYKNDILKNNLKFKYINVGLMFYIL